MASRTVDVPQGPWLDLAAAASPELVEGKTYAIEWSNRTIGYLRLTYDGDAPDIRKRGTKIFARNDPRVPPAYFTVPAAPAKIWIRAVECGIEADVRPADRGGDGSSAP